MSRFWTSDIDLFQVLDFRKPIFCIAFEFRNLPIGKHFCFPISSESKFENILFASSRYLFFIFVISLSNQDHFNCCSNIDIRIQQAELEYQLGREELDLLSILEEIQSAKIVLEEQNVAGNQSEKTLFR